MSLCDRLGGENAIKSVVEQFYSLMLADPRVSHYFQGIDMLKQCAQQQAFITMVTGGPANYEGRNMKSAHCKLNINKEEFDITWNHLKASLEHFQVEQSMISEVKDIFYSVEGEIVKETQKAILNNVQNKQSSQKSEMKSSKGCPLRNMNQSSSIAFGQKLSNSAYCKHFY